MYRIEALKLPFRLSFTHRTPSHTEDGYAVVEQDTYRIN